MSSFIRPIRAIIFGPPGSGKGTILSKLKKTHPQIFTTSSGDLLRQSIKNPDSEIAKLISSGQLVPNDLMLKMIEGHYDNNNLFDNNQSWILDGFPRTKTQAKDLDNLLLEKKSPLNIAIELSVPYDIILNRIQRRFIHKPSGRVYNLDYNPPKTPGIDDITGEPLTKRSDDNEEVFLKRLDVYDQLAKDLKDYYFTNHLLKTVAGPTSDVIFPQLLRIIENDFINHSP